MPDSPGEAELLSRLRGEDPAARAARRAWERWVTAARLQQAVERRGLVGVDAAAFICYALWPEMPAPHREAVLRAVAAGELELRPPLRIEDAVSARELALLAEAGLF
jgi:hypothetical protein